VVVPLKPLRPGGTDMGSMKNGFQSSVALSFAWPPFVGCQGTGAGDILCDFFTRTSSLLVL